MIVLHAVTENDSRNVIRAEYTMLFTFVDTHTSCLLVFERAKVERKVTKLLLHVGDDLLRRLQLQLVLLVWEVVA